MSKQPWYLIECKALVETGERDGERVAEIYILEDIGTNWWTDDGVAAKDFIDDVRALGEVDRIDLHVASPGGSIIDGLAIYNFLRQHPAPVTAYVDGIAASIASVIVMAADVVVMPENALLMIHDPWSFAVGNAADMRKVADDLDKIKSGLVAAYAAKTGLDTDEIARLMAEETWLTAEEALDKGFADRVDEPLRMAALADPEQAKAKVLEVVKARLAAAPDPEPRPEPKGAPKPEPKQEPKQEPQPRGADPAEIVAMCKDAGVPELVPLAIERGAGTLEVASWLASLQRIRTYCIAADLSEDDAKQVALARIDDPDAAIGKALALAVAAHDGADIQTRIHPDRGAAAPRAADIYQRRREARQNLTRR